MNLPQLKLISTRGLKVLSLLIISSAMVISYQNCGKRNTSSQHSDSELNNGNYLDRSHRARTTANTDVSKTLQSTNEQGVCPSNASDRAAIQAIADSLSVGWRSSDEQGHTGFFDREAGSFHCDDSGVRVIGLSMWQAADTLLISRLSALERLDLYGIDDAKLRNLRTLTQLKKLDLGKGRETGSIQITDISPLSALTRLEELDLSFNNIQNISALRGLTQLKELHLYNNQIQDVEPLSGLTQLKLLSLEENNIQSIDGLSQLLQLEGLSLYKNNITNITALSRMTALKGLSLSENRISDLTPIRNLTSLESLYATKNQIQNIPILSGLTNLKYLYLGENRIIDLNPLANMQQLESVILSHNQIENIQSLSNLTNLHRLDLSYNNIQQISSVFRNLTELSDLNLSYNRISGNFNRLNFPETLQSSQGYSYRYNLSNNLFCGVFPGGSYSSTLEMRVFSFENNNSPDSCFTQERPNVRVNSRVAIPGVTTPFMVTTGSLMFASVGNLRANNAQGCAEVGAANHCQGPNAQFTDFPNADWSYDGQLWNTQMQIPREWSGLTVRMYFKNKTNGLVSEPYTVYFNNPIY